MKHAIVPPEYNIEVKTSLCHNWLFKADEVEEAQLAIHLAALGAKTGISMNDMQHIFPMILRMMKSNSGWAK
jgi:hypothetical protein